MLRRPYHACCPAKSLIVDCPCVLSPYDSLDVRRDPSVTCGLHAAPFTSLRCHPALSALSNKHFYNSRLIDGVSAGQRSALVAGLGPLVFCDCQGGRSQSADSGSRSSVNRTEAQMVVQLVLAVLKCRSSSNGGILAQQQQQQQGGILSQQQCREQRGGNAMHDSDIEDSISEEGPSAGNHRQQQQQQDDEEGDGAGHEGQAPAVHAHQLGVICFFKAQATLIRQLLAAGVMLQGRTQAHQMHRRCHSFGSHVLHMCHWVGLSLCGIWPAAACNSCLIKHIYTHNTQPPE